MRTLRGLTLMSGRVFCLCWIALIHLAGIWLFLRGFIRVRVALPEVNSCNPSDATCTLSPTFERAVLVIVDHPHAVSPHSIQAPLKLSQTHPDRSIVFRTFANPPETTMRKFKRIIAGAAPTFIEAGHDLNGMNKSTVAEDSLLQQLSSAGKRVRQS